MILRNKKTDDLTKPANLSDQQTDLKKFSRRDFVISCVGSSSLIIAGYFLFKNTGIEKMLSIIPQKNPVFYPQLKKEVIFGKDDGNITIYTSENNQPVLCAINEPGKIILNNLDGYHTVEDIGRLLGEKTNVESLDLLNAQIANFIAQLGSLGFLKDPFYTNIFYESVEQS